MKTFNVEVHYQASVWHEIEADTAEEAVQKAEVLMRTEIPYGELYSEIVWVEDEDGNGVGNYEDITEECK